MQKLFLLDAYALIYRAYYALIRSPRLNSRGENTSAVFGFVNTLDEVLRKERPDFIAVAFDPSGPTFRHEAYPAYKAQREATPEDIRRSVPVIKDIVRAYRIPLAEVAGFEADDVIGTLARRGAEAGMEVHMVTPDKDYAQLVAPGIFMHRPGHGGTSETLGPAEVCAKYGIERTDQVRDLLALMGDAADNIPGCPGVGEKTAVKLIGQFDSVENLLLHTGELRGALKKKVEDAAEQIRFSKFLATIRTDVPIPFEPEALRRREPDADALRSLFEQLEFRSLIRRIVDGGADSAPATPKQGSLFGSEPTEEAGAPEKSMLKALKDVPHSYHLVESEAEMAQLFQKIATSPIVCLDTETTGTDALSARLVGLSFSTEPGEAWYVPVPAAREAAQRVVDVFRPIYENPAIRKVGQNLKYDLQVLASYGVTLAGPMFDTMLAHYVVQPELHHNMDALAESYLHYRTIHIEELIGPRGKGQLNMADLAPADVSDYACEDADVTLRLVEPLTREMEQSGTGRVFREIEMPLMPVLADMERTGVRLDTGALAATGRLFTERMEAIEREVYALAGHSFTITSPRQVGEVLFGELGLNPKAKRTKSGQYSTSEEVLEALRQRHPIVGKILEHRALKKLLSTYVEALPRLVRPKTGHVHTSFNQAVTATGRLSSSNPNLQNIPVRGDDGREIRKAFVPEPGCLFLSADYSQVELRIMAHLSADAHLIEAFRAGHDIHAATAARIFKKDIADVSRDERRKAKTANFGIIYGISAFGLAERMEVSRTEARELIDSYFETYPGVHQYMERSVAQARERGYIETLFGRRRYLPDILSKNAVVRGYAERNAINAPIQGTAADIIKLAMVRVHERFRREGLRSKMILQVHDELCFSVLPDELDAVRAIVTGEMEGACALSVPLVAECGVGANWLEAH